MFELLQSGDSGEWTNARISLLYYAIGRIGQTHSEDHVYADREDVDDIVKSFVWTQKDIDNFKITVDAAVPRDVQRLNQEEIAILYSNMELNVLNLRISSKKSKTSA